MIDIADNVSFEKGSLCLKICGLKSRVGYNGTCMIISSVFFIAGNKVKVEHFLGHPSPALTVIDLVRTFEISI